MTLEFQTYSIVAGSAYCNASCYFCVSKMTTDTDRVRELSDKTVEVNWRNFKKASRLAQLGGAATVLITGKGEPTMYPKEITDYLEHLEPYNFPLIELQSNGTLFQHQIYKKHDHLQDWYDHGLNTVILSIVSTNPEQNRRVYLPGKRGYPPLEKTIDILHDYGFSVRLGVIGLKNHVDNPKKLEELVRYAKRHGVEQLTWRPVNKADNTVNPEINRRIAKNEVTDEQQRIIHDYMEEHGTPLQKLVHGATVYDFRGQNLCLTHSLTRDPDSNRVRQLIFFSTGEVMYDWEYPGAIILGKCPEAKRRDKERLQEMLKGMRGS